MLVEKATRGFVRKLSTVSYSSRQIFTARPRNIPSSLRAFVGERETAVVLVRRDSLSRPPRRRRVLVVPVDPNHRFIPYYQPFRLAAEENASVQSLRSVFELASSRCRLHLLFGKAPSLRGAAVILAKCPLPLPPRFRRRVPIVAVVSPSSPSLSFPSAREKSATPLSHAAARRVLFLPRRARRKTSDVLPPHFSFIFSRGRHPFFYLSQPHTSLYLAASLI